MPIILPDSTKFDADSDRISTSRPELKKISDAINTLGTQWNSNGDSFGVGEISEIVAGPGISVSTPDSAGSVIITNTANITNYNGLSHGSETLDATASGSPTVTASGLQNIHKVNYGSYSVGGVTKYAYINIDTLFDYPGKYHIFMLYGVIGATSNIAAFLNKASTPISDSLGQIIPGSPNGDDYYGFTIFVVDSDHVIVQHMNGGTTYIRTNQ